jgi:hypothetical protein
MGIRGRKSRAELALVPFQLEGNRPHPASTAPKPPSHLGEPERQIWAGIFRDYNLSADVATAVLAASAWRFLPHGRQAE